MHYVELFNLNMLSPYLNEQVSCKRNSLFLVPFFFPSHSQLAVSEQGLSSEDLQNYLGSAIIVFNLHTKQLVFSSILHVSRVSNSLCLYSLWLTYYEKSQTFTLLLNKIAISYGVEDLCFNGNALIGFWLQCTVFGGKSTGKIRLI